MRLIALAWRYLWARPLVAALNLALLALGVAAMSFVLLRQRAGGAQACSATSQGIDLVVGAKGSPLQLILAGVFHLDVAHRQHPAGLAEDAARALAGRARVVPLSLGDSLKGFRIVGSTLQYPALYGVQLARGRVLDRQTAGRARRRRRAPTPKLEASARPLHRHARPGPASGEAHGDTPLHRDRPASPAAAACIDRLVLDRPAVGLGGARNRDGHRRRRPHAARSRARGHAAAGGLPLAAGRRERCRAGSMRRMGCRRLRRRSNRRGCCAWSAPAPTCCSGFRRGAAAGGGGQASSSAWCTRCASARMIWRCCACSARRRARVGARWC